MTWGADTFEILLSVVGRSSSKWSCPENRICTLLEILELWNYFDLASERTGEKYAVFVRHQGFKKIIFGRKRIWVRNFDLGIFLISKNLAKSVIV